jgi:hypothetical protein
MRYVVQFDMRSELGANASEAVYRALVSSFGRIDNFKIVADRVYVGYIQENGSIAWREVGPG